MDLFMSISLGIGLALAAGSILGAVARPGPLGIALALAAVVAGAAIFALVLSDNDHVWWGGIPAGAVVGGLAFTVAQGIASGAIERATAGDGEASAFAIGGTLVLAALAIAALSTLLSPIALPVLAAYAWMGLARRRRSQRKYEGLRVLR